MKLRISWRRGCPRCLVAYLAGARSTKAKATEGADSTLASALLLQLLVNLESCLSPQERWLLASHTRVREIRVC